MIAFDVLETAMKDPRRLALAYGNRLIDYGTLGAKARSAAALLGRLGVSRGDRVVLSASNADPSFVFGYLGCQLAGAVAVPVYAKISGAHLRRIIEETRPRAVFLARAPWDGVEGLPLESLDCSEPAPAGFAGLGLDDTSEIVFTTGTTGLPKGVELTTRNLRAFARIRRSAIGARDPGRELIPLPLNHVFGLGRLRCSLQWGGAAIIVDGFHSPAKIFQAFDEHKATSFCCVPAGFAMLFELTDDLLGDYRGQLRFIETASAPLPPAHKKRLMELLPKTHLFMAYGLTEAAGSILYTEFHGSRHKLKSVGKPSAGVEVALSEAGQIRVRGEMVMKGYWNNPPETAKALVDGWLVTNDIGYQDAEGFLYLSGRKEEIINVGGLKVAPVEVEDVIREHPVVRECACVGVKDPKGWSGETVMAYLVHEGGPTRPSSDELVDFLRKKLEPHKIPSEFRWIDELPRTATGKIQRTLLKERGVN